MSEEILMWKKEWDICAKEGEMCEEVKEERDDKESKEERNIVEISRMIERKKKE